MTTWIQCYHLLLFSLLLFRECSSTSMLQNHAFYSGQIEAFWKVLPFFTVALIARALSHWPDATWLLNKWLYWEFRECGQWENPVTYELLSIPGFPKSFCSALLPVVRLCWAFQWAKGSGTVPLWRRVTNIFVPSSALSYFRSQLPAFTHSKVLADWGVLLGTVKVMSALSEFHPKSEEALVWSGHSSWCGWEGRLGRVRRAGEVIAALLVKWKEILKGVCEIHWLLLPLETSPSSSVTPQGQKSSAAAGQWWVLSQGLHLLRGVQGKCPVLSAALLPHPSSIWLFTLS